MHDRSNDWRDISGFFEAGKLLRNIATLVL